MPADDTIPIQISDTVARGTVKPTYPVIEYPHNRGRGGDAIANGFIYRGKQVPALKDKLVFGDITTGRIWYADRADVLAADDGNPATRGADSRDGRRACAASSKRRTARAAARARRCPGWRRSGRGRVDLRFAVDNDGELYILTKSDGMIRKVVGARADDGSGVTPRCARVRLPVRTSPTQPAASLEKSRGVDAGVDRRREAGLRRQLRRLPRQPGAGRGEGRHRRSRSSRSSAASSRRTSPTTSGTTARATARSSPSSSAACRRR